MAQTITHVPAEVRRWTERVLECQVCSWGVRVDSPAHLGLGDNPTCHNQPLVEVEREYQHVTPAHSTFKCKCGRNLSTLYVRFDVECDCGRIYNAFGQELAPRHLWGEETGEHWSEIYRGFDDEGGIY